MVTHSFVAQPLLGTRLTGCGTPVGSHNTRRLVHVPSSDSGTLQAGGVIFSTEFTQRMRGVPGWPGVILTPESWRQLPHAKVSWQCLEGLCQGAFRIIKKHDFMATLIP